MAETFTSPCWLGKLRLSSLVHYLSLHDSRDFLVSAFRIIVEIASVADPETSPTWCNVLNLFHDKPWF
ncbi:hypothetical protein MYX76_08570 [Desulfobacterota bacterium AH_259_B03_O07]|nr:hypothetical protein [Desulfobacterota bacterium AH_259_B03_O07]